VVAGVRVPAREQSITLVGAEFSTENAVFLGDGTAFTDDAFVLGAAQGSTTTPALAAGVHALEMAADGVVAHRRPLGVSVLAYRTQCSRAGR
jgi:hypothetical protein